MSSANFLRIMTNITQVPLQVIEVGLRDGLQNVKNTVPTEKKFELFKKLVDTGVKKIEVTSFVSPKAIPQLSDAADLLRMIEAYKKEYTKENKNKNFPLISVLVPNMKGFELASQHDVIDEYAVFLAASEKFSQRNINCSVSQSLEKYEPLVRHMKKHQPKKLVRGYISCVFGCPYDRCRIELKVIHRLVETLILCGCDEVSLGDTNGIADPVAVAVLLEYLIMDKFVCPVNQLAVHFHDTYNQALPNVLTSIIRGIRKIDASVAGLGGCPFANGATGNLATEDLLFMAKNMGMNLDGVDLHKYISAGKFVRDEIGLPINSRVTNTYLRKQEK